MPAALRSLPLARWASRFAGGTVVLTGLVEGGPIRIELAFVGGDPPRLISAPPGLEALVDQLHDVTIDARAVSDTELVVKLGHGIVAHVPAGGEISLRAVCKGPPEAPRLLDVLEARVGGAGVRIGHQRARWLAALARVRIHRASLHPDGAIALEGSGLGLLSVASTRLTQLIRRSPRFARVRAFLP